MCNCNCLANGGIKCVADKCCGPITGFDIHLGTPELRRKMYAAAVKMFWDVTGTESLRPVGNWEYDPVNEVRICNVCKGKIDSSYYPNYCPWCGAKMGGTHMSEIFGCRVVKTRKPHVCFGCGRKFLEGSKMEKSCVADGTLWTCYLCETCQRVSKELDQYDEYGFGDLRERAFALELEAKKAGASEEDAI